MCLGMAIRLFCVTASVVYAPNAIVELERAKHERSGEEKG